MPNELTTERLRELLAICERATDYRAVCECAECVAFKEAFANPTTCAALVREVLRLRKEAADYESTDLVPRSRWEATNSDWLEAREQVRNIAARAAERISELENDLRESSHG